MVIKCLFLQNKSCCDMLVVPISSWPEGLAAYTCTSHLLYCPTTFVISFTVGVGLNLTLPHVLSLCFFLNFPLSTCSILYHNSVEEKKIFCQHSLTTSPEKHLHSIQILFKSYFTYKFCKTKHIFKVAVPRYNLAATALL